MTWKARISLVGVIYSICHQPNHSIGPNVIKLLQDLNSFSTKQIDEPDFERRLNTFSQLNGSDDASRSALTPKTRELLIQHFLFQNRDPDELSLGGSAASALCRFLELAEFNRDEVEMNFQVVMLPGLKRMLRSKLEIIRKDLIKREIQIQDDITALMPLMNFASVEPSFGTPFQAAKYLQIARANQLILDRNRDARIAIGTTPLPRKIMSEFVEKLAPCRRPTLFRIKTSLYLCTSTLQSKKKNGDSSHCQRHIVRFRTRSSGKKSSTTRRSWLVVWLPRRKAYSWSRVRNCPAIV